MGHDSASTSSNDFKPLYVIPHGKKKQVDKLKRRLKEASELLLATDEDREGESIAWHLVQVLEPDVPGPAAGLPRDHPAGHRARARRAARYRPEPGRRPGDSPHRGPAGRLRGLAGAVAQAAAQAVRGRVQSVATRLVVAREEARMRFVAADFAGPRGRARHRTRRRALVPGAPGRARGQDAWPTARTSMPRPARSRNAALLVLDEPAASALRAGSRRAAFRVAELDREALHQPALPAVHDLDAAAGGRPQAALRRPADDAGRPAAVRERPHHLHANRLADPVG